MQWLLGEPVAKTGGRKRSSRWPSVRKACLRDNPACAACGRKESLEAHHVVPFHVAPEFELVRDNLIVLCDDGKRSCHRCFGHLWNWTLWNPEVRRMAAEFREQLEGKP